MVKYCPLLSETRVKIYCSFEKKNGIKGTRIKWYYNERVSLKNLISEISKPHIKG